MGRPDVAEVPYLGSLAVRLRSGPLAAFVATGFGPRIVGLEVDDSGNLFAVLPRAALPTPDGGRFHFRGGHRLWVGPESPARTYRPDDAAVDVEELDAGLRVTGAADRATGLRKAIELRADGDGRMSVRHTVYNVGPRTALLAPWAITQLPLGGRAILPLATGAGPESPLPDRRLVLWPYTDVGDARLRLRNELVEVTTDRTAVDAPGARLKVGGSTARGALGYVRDGWLFAKRSAVTGERGYPDLGADAQVYCDGRFLELESVGPLAEVAPGERAEHVERWMAARVGEASSIDALLEPAA
jgi:hypothetical protein